MQRLFLSLVVVVLGCLAIPPILYADDAEGHFNRGIDLYEKGEYDRAIDAFSQAQRLLDPNDNARIAAANYNRGNAYEKKGEFDKAIADFSEAIRSTPVMPQPTSIAASPSRRRANTTRPLPTTAKPWSFDPKNTTEVSHAYYNRGIAWSEKKQYDKAIADYNKALAVDPNNADFYLNRGNAHEKNGEYDKAIADYNKALAVDSKHVASWNDLAWLQATCPDEKYRDGKRAIENANKAYELDGGKHWQCVGTLAAAYAENGDFEKAKDWGTKAVTLTKADKTASDKDRVEASACLELYKQEKTYRQELKKK